MASSDGDGENSSEDAVEESALPALLRSSDEDEDQDEDQDEDPRDLGGRFVLALSSFTVSRPRRLRPTVQ